MSRPTPRPSSGPTDKPVAEKHPEKGPEKGPIRQWVDAFVFAFLVMVFVRTLFFDLFRIPTPSMEKNLLVGDYLFVSKLHYGTRLPLSLGLPFSEWYLPGVNFPYLRGPAFSSVKRGDAIVFNWPADALYKPVDRKMHYIKRVVGLPGERFELIDKVVYNDDIAYPMDARMQQQWLVRTNDPRIQLSNQQLGALGVEEWSRTNDPTLLQIVATPGAAEAIASWSWVEEVTPYVLPDVPAAQRGVFPGDLGFTRDNFGPVVIPKAGMTVPLNDENFSTYSRVIQIYEGHQAERRTDGAILIDGAVADSYTFSQDYFFVMGDNRDNSEDARYWGFVPMEYVVGKAVLVYFSWDADRMLPRFSRLMHLIN